MDNLRKIRHILKLLRELDEKDLNYILVCGTEIAEELQERENQRAREAVTVTP